MGVFNSTILSVFCVVFLSLLCCCQLSYGFGPASLITSKYSHSLTCSSSTSTPILSPRSDLTCTYTRDNSVCKRGHRMQMLGKDVTLSTTENKYNKNYVKRDSISLRHMSSTDLQGSNIKQNTKLSNLLIGLKKNCKK